MIICYCPTVVVVCVRVNMSYTVKVSYVTLLVLPPLRRKCKTYCVYIVQGTPRVRVIAPREVLCNPHASVSGSKPFLNDVPPFVNTPQKIIITITVYAYVVYIYPYNK